MGPEAKLYQKLRKNSKGIVWTRLENISSLGTPDLLGYNNSGTFFTVELKVTKGKTIRFSPHQISFHIKHPKHSFILARHLGQRCLKLFPGSMILELEACGLELGASILRLGASRGLPLILIRGPCLVQPLLMIFNSRAIVDSCAAVACLTSIVNFFI